MVNICVYIIYTTYLRKSKPNIRNMIEIVKAERNTLRSFVVYEFVYLVQANEALDGEILTLEVYR